MCIWYHLARRQGSQSLARNRKIKVVDLRVMNMSRIMFPKELWSHTSMYLRRKRHWCSVICQAVTSQRDFSPGLISQETGSTCETIIANGSIKMSSWLQICRVYYIPFLSYLTLLPSLSQITRYLVQPNNTLALTYSANVVRFFVSCSNSLFKVFCSRSLFMIMVNI